jgi:CheY-like chemotaxis protein
LGQALIVEDEPILALAMAEALHEAGADTVTTCHSTTTARAAMQALRPAILVLDVHLADRDDGWALAELAVAMSPTPPLIVFSTGTPESIPRASPASAMFWPSPSRPMRWPISCAIMPGIRGCSAACATPCTSENRTRSAVAHEKGPRRGGGGLRDRITSRLDGRGSRR